MRHKLSLAGVIAFAIMLAGCGTAPTKTLPAQVAVIAPTVYSVLANGAVGLAVSKGVKPSDIATIAFQLNQFASGQSVSVQALTTEIQKLETQAGLNLMQTTAITELRGAFDTIILGFVTNGVISGTAKTTLTAILNEVMTAAILLGAPDPSLASSANTTADASGPPAPAVSRQSSSMMTLESPPVVGAATSMVAVAALKAFAHINVSSPVAASITVLGTFLAAWLATH